jgi:putative oxidoreductase
MRKILKTGDIPALLVRLVVGLIFLSEGIQKILFPDVLGAGRFAKIGFTHPSFWTNLTASFEITCGILILLGLLTRIVSIPLLIVMATAFVTTKLPILLERGFWAMAHEYRTDFAMTMLLLYLLWLGGGKYSIDGRLYGKKK